MSSPSSAMPPPASMRSAGAYFGDEKMQALGDRTGAHEGLHDLVDGADAVAGFLFDLGADALFRAGVVEQAGGRFDQETVVAVDEGGQAELARQHHAAARAVVQQDGGAVAAIVHFARLRLPAAVAPALFEAEFLQQVPVIGQHFLGGDADGTFLHGILLKWVGVFQNIVQNRAMSRNYVQRKPPC